MSEIFRKKYYQCSSSSIYNEEVNCVHWKSHIDTCTHTCDLKLFENPKVTDCMKCKSRQSYSDDILNKDKKTNQFTNMTIRKTESSFSLKLKNIFQQKRHKYYKVKLMMKYMI